MESLESPIMHATETQTICSTLPCASNGVDVISKKLEDELLYGTTEDMDEDDAQSDDSLRLRLSDDDADADDIGASLPINNQTKQSEKTEPLDTEFDIHTSNDCSKQHQDNSSGLYSIADEDNGFEKKLDFTNDDVPMENNLCDTGEKNAFERERNQFLMLHTAVKYTYAKPQKLASSFKTYSYEDNQSFPVHQSSSDHSYYSIGSNHYCNKYYNQNSHYGQCRGYKFGQFNTYFNSLGLTKKPDPRVYPPSNKKLSGKKYVTPGSNSQTNVSAIENTSQQDNSSSGIENIQHSINNDIKSITTENNSPESIEFELSTDKLNAPLNLSEDPPQLSDIQNEPKGLEILGKGGETVTAIEKYLVIPNVEQLSMQTNAQTKNGDIPQNTVVANVNCQQSSAKSSNNQEIHETQSSTLEVMLFTPIRNVSNNETITNNEKLTPGSEDDSIAAHNESIIAKSDRLKDHLDKISNTDPTIGEKNDNSILENYPILRCNQNNDDNVADDHDEIEIGTKRSLSISENENTICKKIQCQKMINKNVDTSTLANNEEEQSSSIEVISTTDECSQLGSIIKRENIAHKSENEPEKSNITGIIKSESLDEKTSILPIEIIDDDENLDRDDDKLEITAVIPSTEISAKCKRRRRKRKINPSCDVLNSGQEKENVRQKRETAQKAEEMIRKRFQSNDSDSESDDNVSTYVSYNKPNLRAQPSSPPSLKRNCLDEPIESNAVKKPKKGIDNSLSKTTETMKSNDSCKTLDQVRKFFWRDGKKSLSKFTQEELEELLVQKVIETITMRDEIGRLREQAKISERNQEATRMKCQQLTKQMKDFEMVLNRFAADRRGGDKAIPPIKINRSVGLQVNFVTDNGIQNLRQLQHNTTRSNATVVANGGNSSPKPSAESTNNNSNSRKGIKVRSPRRPSDVSTVSPTLSTGSTQIPLPATSTVTPAALVVTKTADNRHIINSPGQVITQQGTVTINGAITTMTRQTKVLTTRSNSSSSSSTTSSNNNNSSSNSIKHNNNNSNATNNNENLIDLTGEEEKSKNAPNLPPLSAITAVSNPVLIPKVPPRYQRVIQPTPANVTITQPAFKLLQTVDKPMPTAIVNNMNAPRLTFVMHGIAGQRQLLIPSNTHSIRPAVTTNNRAPFPAITYTGVHTISNGSVRVLPPTTTAPAQKQKHPAALPGVTTYPLNAALKLPPPAPSLKISKVANGIVLSWNMRTSDEYAEIASYQLFAYQEVTGMAPSTALWKKVGDVRALPLPMACTLTQFSEGNNYYFAVRAVDTHSRLGLYSHPGNISL